MITIKDIKTSNIKTIENSSLDFVPNLGEKITVRDTNDCIIIHGVVCSVQHSIITNNCEQDLTIFVY